jgi:hypothetical protein
MVLSVAYIGSGTSKLSGLNDINAPKPGPGPAPPRRLFPTFGAINTLSAFAHASYHSLQAKLERRFQSGFSLLSSYTWAHSIDNSTDGEDNNNGPNFPQDSYNTNAEKAFAGFRHQAGFVTSAFMTFRLGAQVVFSKDQNWSNSVGC